jgi:hypothetical protein
MRDGWKGETGKGRLGIPYLPLFKNQIGGGKDGIGRFSKRA